MPGGDDETNPYTSYIEEVGALAMGATTYEWIRVHHPGEWFYGDTPVYVWTSHPDDVVARDDAVVRPVTGTLDEVQLRDVRDRHEYLSELDARRQTVRASIEEQGKLTPELAEQLIGP